MKSLTIIGTRPQYIKIKPLYDYFKSNNINNILIDTNQHYSANVSSIFINEFELHIDYNLGIINQDPVNFLTECIQQIANCIDKEKPDIVIVIGDTNSTLAAAIAAKKKHLKLAHIEAGIRCGDKNRPEEINRILVDEVADIHFTSRQRDNFNVENPTYVGDLEYYFINKLEDKNIINEINYDNFLLMTIHRYENCNVDRIKIILDFCGRLASMNSCRIIFPIHHRTKKIIDENKIEIPEEVDICDPKSYIDILFLLKNCMGVISDSGGIVKLSPYFGKKCIVPLDSIEWTDIIERGYGINQLDYHWFDNFIIERNRDFYYVEKSCERIVKELYKVSKSR